MFIIIFLCIPLLIFYKTYDSFNKLTPYLSFMNTFLSYFCHNGPFFSNQEKINIFPVSLQLESQYELIKNDYINYHQPLQSFNKMLPDFKLKISDNDWKIIPLKTVGKINKQYSNYFPSLKNILSNSSIHNAFFSIFEPNTKIPIHTGPYKGYLRYHLGIIIPHEDKEPYINVGGITYFWEEGKGILFDDLYPHYAENPTCKKRVVLFIDVIRPLLGIIGFINKMNIWLFERNPVMKKIDKIQHQPIKI